MRIVHDQPYFKNLPQMPTDKPVTVVMHSERVYDFDAGIPGFVSTNLIKGFTILELMVSLFTLGLLTALAGPSVAEFYSRQQIASQAQSLSGALSLARSTALSDATVTKVCWNRGSATKNVDGFGIEPGNLAVLLGTTGVAVVDIQTSDSLFIDDDETDDCMAFSTQGRLDLNSVTGTTLVFGVCKESGDTSGSRSVTLSQTGRALVEKNVGASGTATINCS